MVLPCHEARQLAGRFLLAQNGKLLQWFKKQTNKKKNWCFFADPPIFPSVLASPDAPGWQGLSADRKRGDRLWVWGPSKALSLGLGLGKSGRSATLLLLCLQLTQIQQYSEQYTDLAGEEECHSNKLLMTRTGGITQKRICEVNSSLWAPACMLCACAV